MGTTFIGSAIATAWVAFMFATIGVSSRGRRNIWARIS
jgi:hypothetical protein